MLPFAFALGRPPTRNPFALSRRLPCLRYLRRLSLLLPSWFGFRCYDKNYDVARVYNSYLLSFFPFGVLNS